MPSDLHEHTVSYDLPGYDRQREVFATKQEAEARQAELMSNADVSRLSVRGSEDDDEMAASTVQVSVEIVVLTPPRQDDD